MTLYFQILKIQHGTNNQYEFEYRQYVLKTTFVTKGYAKKNTLIFNASLIVL